MFSGMCKPILSFVFRKIYCKVYIYANIIIKKNGHRSKTADNIVSVDNFFLFRLCLVDSPMVISGRMWSSHPCGFFETEIQNGCHEITEVTFQ